MKNKIKYHSDQPFVEILLSTYNGEDHLKELLDSIFDQTYKNWRIIIRDDLSFDSTPGIIESYGKNYPDKIRILDNPGVNLGPSQSFHRLLEAGRADCMAFCDQDDYWMPDKLEIQVEKLNEAENKFGKDIPLLVHSDLQVCDNNMTIMSDSFWAYQNIAPDEMKDIRCLLVQNFVTGCTVLINRKLADIAIPIPQETIMFDWWFALLAQKLGKIITIKVPLVKYRQHGNNAVGAKKWGFNYVISQIFREKSVWRTSLENTRFQADALIKRLTSVGVEDLDIIQQYSRLYEKPWITRKVLYLMLGIRKYGNLRQFITWLLI